MDRFFEFVESGLGVDCPAMVADRVVPSFLRSAERHSFQSLTAKNLRLWVTDMLCKGMKLTTCRRYVGALHTLFRGVSENYGNKYGCEDPFIAVKADLHRQSECQDSKTADNLSLIPRLLKKEKSSSDWQIVNIVLYLLYNVKSSLEDVVRLRFEDPVATCLHAGDIIDGMRVSPQQKYVFALGQGKKREQRIIHDLLADMHTVLRMSGMDFGTEFSRESITSMWIHAALGKGVTYGEIRAILPELPRDWAFLSLVEPADIDADRECSIINRVADAINDKTVRWYVMKLRSGISPEDITSEENAFKGSGFEELSFYYPVRKVVRRENRKMVTEELPYLPGLLFFRMRSDKVGRFMSLTGNKAWCYRVTNSPDSPYSFISRSEMTRFQRHIGKLTADVEMELVNRYAAAIGDKVRISGGGLLEGQEGIVREIRNVDGSCTYVLRLSESSFIRWNDVKVDETFVESVS